MGKNPSTLESLLLSTRMTGALLEYTLENNSFDYVLNMPKVLANWRVFHLSPWKMALRRYLLTSFGEAQQGNDAITYAIENKIQWGRNIAFRKLFNPIKWGEFIYGLTYEATTRVLNALVPLVSAALFIVLAIPGAIVQGISKGLFHLAGEKEAEEDKDEGGLKESPIAASSDIGEEGEGGKKEEDSPSEKKSSFSPRTHTAALYTFYTALALYAFAQVITHVVLELSLIAADLVRLPLRLGSTL